MSASATPRPSKRAGQQPRPSSIRETVFEDYPRIAALHARHGVASKSEHEWVTQWITNPAYDGQPIGWVVEAANGEIVGSVASLAAAYYLRGRKLRAAVAGDWAVDSQYRGYSLQLMARLMIQEHADIVLTTTASPNAEAVLATFGWRRAPVGSWNKVAFWVTDHRGFAKAALTAMSVPFASAVSYPLASALSIGTCLNRAHFQKVLSCAAPQPCTRFDDRFDTLWEELKVQNEGVLLGCRTQQALAWHFRNAKPGENCWILTASNGPQLTAYAIFDRRDHGRGGLKRARIIDFQALGGYERQLEAFLAWMLSECRRLGIHVLENLGCWLVRPGLPRVSIPFVRTLSSWSFFYTVKDPDLARAVENPTVWAPSSFDGDVAI